jgi:hypothetical protein
MVRAHKIRGQVVAVAEILEFFQPFLLGRRRPAHREPGVHPLDRRYGMAVQFKIVRPGARPECFQVRLIPDFEKPLPHLREAVALHPVGGQLADQFPPLGITPGRCHIAPVMKNRPAAGREDSGHEAQLHEGLHADGQEIIENLVGIEK